MENLPILIRLAKDPDLSNRVPEVFARALRLHTSGVPRADWRFAWRLFQEVLRPVSIEEVREYIRKRKATVVDPEDVDESKVGCVESHFLDSGSFTLWTRAKEWAAKEGLPEEAFYNTPEHWEYLDGYAKFVKEFSAGVDLYANVDAIGYAATTWRNQQYLEEKHDLKPVPVVHYKTHLRWLEHYVNRGYEIIALGGLVGSMDQENCKDWIDQCFDYVCDGPGRLPRVKIHGFGVTSYRLMIRYPWYSVDSTTWTKVGAFGGILVPHKRKGKWDFSEEPYQLKVSEDSPSARADGRHFSTLKAVERAVVLEWLEYINVPVGGPDVQGVTTHHSMRKVANLLFFEELRGWLPAYPWPFRSTRKKGLGIFK